jgi:hypothetical protein
MPRPLMSWNGFSALAHYVGCITWLTLTGAVPSIMGSLVLAHYVGWRHLACRPNRLTWCFTQHNGQGLDHSIVLYKILTLGTVRWLAGGVHVPS